MLTAVLTVVVAAGQAASPAAPCRLAPAESSVAAGVHAPFDRLLRAFVRDGEVDYRCFGRHAAALDGYLAALARTDAGALSDDAALALWINAYNAFTIRLILSRYPRIKSIKDIPRRWSRRDWVVGGRRYSLNDIEHAILRPARDHRFDPFNSRQIPGGAIGSRELRVGAVDWPRTPSGGSQMPVRDPVVTERWALAVLRVSLGVFLLRRPRVP